ncbi:MAG: hypothetical protein PHR35_14265 [Kiritimatiellae bacterium]|nr:hypothetical protein [Kiritimatiellia bacterium]
MVAKYQAVFAEPPRHIPTPTATDAPLLGNGDLGVAVGGSGAELCYWIAKNDFWKLRSRYDGSGVRMFGTLRLVAPALRGASYRVEQDFQSAVTSATFGVGAVVLRVRSWVAATANILVVELQATGAPLKVSVELAPGTSDDSDSSAGRDGDLLWVRRGFARGVDIPVVAACVLRVVGASGSEYVVEPGRPVRVVLAMASSFEAPDCRRHAETLLTGHMERLDRLWQEHAAWWGRFWGQSEVAIGDPVIEQRYYLSQYVMGSASRNRDFPPSIFGTWITTDSPAWFGDYHLNYNHQAPYYGLYSSNHIEQADPADAVCLAFMERGEWYARNLQGCRGIYYPVGIGPKGIETTRANPPHIPWITDGQGVFHGQKSNAAYCAVNMAMRWYHTYDRVYAQRVYPFVRAVADFWTDYLDWDGTRYVIANDSIHEGSGNDYNPLLSLGLVRMVFRLVLDISEALGVDDDCREAWQTILGHLSQFPTQVRNGKTVFRYSERGMDWCNSNTLGLQHIFPAGEIGLDSPPDLLAIARNMLEAMPRWRDTNGMSSIYPAAVRIGWDPQSILRELRTMIEAIGLPNGYIRNNPHGIENCSIVPATLNEMLCMGHERVLRVFRVWPWQQDARFRNLRVPGAFLVSAELHEGKVAPIAIVSEQGQPCTVENPWNGADVQVWRDGKAAEKVEGSRFCLPTHPGEQLRLEPVSSR